MSAGPVEIADALQTLKTMPAVRDRIVLREEIGERAFDYITEVTR